MKKAILGVTLSVILGAGAAVGVTTWTGDRDVATASDSANLVSETNAHVEETLAQVSFKMQKPKKLPFQETEVLSSKKEIGKGHLVELSYKDKKSMGYLIIDTTDMKRNLASANYPITEIVLKNGETASYTDNGSVQVLFWSQNDLSYSMKATRGDGKKAFTAEELAEIANSFE